MIFARIFTLSVSLWVVDVLSGKVASESLSGNLKFVGGVTVREKAKRHAQIDDGLSSVKGSQ